MITEPVNRTPSPKQPKTNHAELPQSAQLIAEVIGRDATLALAKGCKHRKLYVPKVLCAGHSSVTGRTDGVVRRRCTCKGHWIARTIGDDLAVKLSWTFGGEILDLAGCYVVHALERNQRIRAEYDAGRSRMDLMIEHGMSERAIRYIIQGHNGRPDLKSPPRKLITH